MEGDLIALASSVTLPAQPASGTTAYVPMGGDGYSAPFAAYAVAGMLITGDASGGAVVFTINMDPRFSSLISYVTFSAIQASSADAEYSWRVIGLPDFPLILDQGDVTAIAGIVSVATIGKTWRPPPVVLPGGGIPNFELRLKNVDTDQYRLNLFAYLFNIDVRQKTPMGPLLWAMGGAGQ